MYKIILDCDLMRYRDSGLYHYCKNLGIHVSSILEKEHDGRIAFYVPAAEKDAFGEDARCIVEKKWHHKYFKPFLRDCTIWHSPFQSGRMVTAGSKRIRNLLTIHDLNCLHEGKSAREQKESLKKTQYLVNQSHAVVCISNHTREDVLAHLNVKGKPLHVIHNGTHQVNVPPSKPSGYLPLRPFLFTMGYVNRKKNFHTLLPLLKDSGIELVVAGKLDEPDYIKQMEQMAVKAGVSEKMHLLGTVSENDKAWYLENCLAFMLPSLAEGFGAPVVEAMKFGKPLFLSARTSLPEIGGEVAFYFKGFEPGHMLQVFKEGMECYQKNGLAGKIIDRAHIFNWKEKAMEYLNVYRSLL